MMKFLQTIVKSTYIRGNNLQLQYGNGLFCRSRRVEGCNFVDVNFTSQILSFCVVSFLVMNYLIGF
jgi:hypothetical protein